MSPFRHTDWLNALLMGAAILLYGMTANAADAKTQSEKRTVLIVGDSLAAGHGVETGESFPALLQEKIDGQKWTFTVVNAGVSGDTSAGGLRRMDWLLRQRVDVLILELGGNDGLRGIAPAVTQTNLQAIIDRTRSRHPEALIIIAGMQMPPNMGEEYQKQFKNIFGELARKNNALLIPFLLEDVGGRPDMNQGDRIHPTPAGHRVIAETVWKVLRPALERMVSPS
jgi:acyl-CoA thioesterase I